MKKTFTLLATALTLCISFVSNAQTTLSAGDLAVILYNADNPDEVSVVLLGPIASGTTINFTDNGWLSSGAFRTGEGTATFTATSDMTCGDIITVSTGFALSTSGDQIIAYQGTAASPTILTGFNNEGAGVWQTTASNSNTSALPTGLTNGTDAVAVTEIDNTVYGGALTGTRAALKADLFDATSFSGSNTVRQSFTSSFTVTDCPVLPVTLINFDAEYADNAVELNWATASEENNDYFLVQRSIDGYNYETLAKIDGSGNSNEVLNYSYTDYSPNAKSFYRLKQVDYDGVFDFSDVLKVEVEEKKVSIAQDLENIVVKANTDVGYDYQLINTNGELVTSGTVYDQVSVSKEGLAKGVYFLNVYTGKEMVTEKLVVL